MIEPAITRFIARVPERPIRATLFDCYDFQARYPSVPELSKLRASNGWQGASRQPRQDQHLDRFVEFVGNLGWH